MSGYRDASNYDPYASPRYGRPLRPFNWVQWTGVAFIVAGLALDAFYFAGRFGWTRAPVNTPMFALPPLLIGVSLVNSRREEVPDVAPELAAARKRWLLIVIAICVPILVVATILALKGA